MSQPPQVISRPVLSDQPAILLNKERAEQFLNSKQDTRTPFLPDLTLSRPFPVPSFLSMQFPVPLNHFIQNLRLENTWRIVLL